MVQVILFKIFSRAALTSVFWLIFKALFVLLLSFNIKEFVKFGTDVVYKH